MPILMNACQKIIAPMPTASTAPKRSFALRRDADRPDAEEAVEAEQHDAADEAPLLGEHREREVGVLIGQELELVLRAPHEPLAEDPAVADGHARVVRVPARAAEIGLGVQERRDALALVVLEAVDPRERHRRRPRCQQRADALPPEPHERRDADEDQHEDDGRAEVGLPQDEQRRDDREQRRDDQILQRAPLAPRIVVQELGERDDRERAS